jgi:hypothetical protein
MIVSKSLHTMQIILNNASINKSQLNSKQLGRIINTLAGALLAMLNNNIDNSATSAFHQYGLKLNQPMSTDRGTT